MISENNKTILDGLDENINVVDSPERVQKVDRIPRKIKLAAATFKKATNWFKKQYKDLKATSIKNNIGKIENDLATKNYKNINDAQERKNTEEYIYKKALKYEKLKDQLDLLITDDKAGIPRRIDIPVEKRAINLKDAMMRALKYNGIGWVLKEEKHEEVFSVNDGEINYNDSQDSIDHDSISEELKNFREPENKENNIIQDLPINSVEEQSFNAAGMTEEEINESVRKIENEDLPINPVEEQSFDATGMTEEEINESMRKIGEYKAEFNNEEPEIENSINVDEENVSTEIKEDGTRVEISNDGKSRMFDFTNVNIPANTDIENSNGTTKVTISDDGKSKLYEFNTPADEKETTKTEPTETYENQTTSNIELDINELKDYRNQLAQLKEQRKAATEAKEKAAQERKAAEMAAQDARMKAQRAKESYLEKINKEQAEIEAINSDINTIASDTAKNNQAARLANEYAEAIEQMISGETVTNDDKGNSK